MNDPVAPTAAAAASSRPGPRLALVPLLGLILLASCAGRLKPPTLTVERLAIQGVKITGMGWDVSFLVRNPNPEALHIERFEYDLTLNGERLGTGYVPQAIDIEGFGQGAVKSRFDMGLLALPGHIKAVIDQKRVRADVKATFYVRDGSALRKLRHSTSADVDLQR